MRRPDQFRLHDIARLLAKHGPPLVVLPLPDRPPPFRELLTPLGHEGPSADVDLPQASETEVLQEYIRGETTVVLLPAVVFLLPERVIASEFTGHKTIAPNLHAAVERGPYDGLGPG